MTSVANSGGLGHAGGRCHCCEQVASVSDCGGLGHGRGRCHGCEQVASVSNCGGLGHGRGRCHGCEQVTSVSNGGCLGHGWCRCHGCEQVASVANCGGLSHCIAQNYVRTSLHTRGKLCLRTIIPLKRTHLLVAKWSEETAIEATQHSDALHFNTWKSNALSLA